MDRPRLDPEEPVATVRIDRDSGHDGRTVIQSDQTKVIRIDEPATIRVQRQSLEERPKPGTLAVRWTPLKGPPRKMVFEPRSIGGWERSEKTWTGELWRHAGSEIVANLHVEPRMLTVESHCGP